MTDINAVINETFDAARRYHTVVNQNQLNNNGELKNKWMPILWFGNLPAYSESKLKVVTVGINPSNQEFPEDPKDFRFNGEAINNAYSAICDNAKLDIELYKNALNEYFSVNPYYTWFDRAFKSVLNALDCSFYSDKSTNTALHIDLRTPIPTSPVWSGLSKSKIITQALTDPGKSIFSHLINALKPDAVILTPGKTHLSALGFKNICGPNIVNTNLVFPACESQNTKFISFYKAGAITPSFLGVENVIADFIRTQI